MVDGVATYLVAVFFGETRDGSVRGVKPFSPPTPTSLRKKKIPGLLSRTSFFLQAKLPSSQSGFLNSPAVVLVSRP